jgi:DnaK suppressor protein
MARRDALLRLHKSLVARGVALRKALAGELADLRFKTTDTGDSADAAFDAGSEEVSSQLAELEARELSQIERALTRIKQGAYGSCELCQAKIPVERLNILPYSTTCVKCQREMEIDPSLGEGAGGDWEKVSESSFDDHREVKISDLEIDVSK